MYMYAAMADLAAELGDDSLKRACEVLWKDVTGKRMYVTAGLGPAAANEGFTVDYDLPNDTAYAETCASVALIFWAQRMLNLELDGAYADVMELALYNGALSGLARNGTQYFYQNPLESDGSHTRWDWHPCPCCTMNVSRLVASIGGYFYSTGADMLAVHLYGGNTANVTVGGTAVKIRQETDYPWSGKVKITIDPKTPTDFALKLRIPSWSRNASVDGERQAGRCGEARSRLCRDQAKMDGRRRGRTRPADAGRAHLRQPAHQDGCRPGRAEARAAGLLPGADRQSRRRSAC